MYSPGMTAHRCPQPVGPREIEIMFDVSRGRIVQLRHEADFPKPWRHLATGVVWRDTDIEDYAHAKGRTFTPYQG